MPSDGVSQYADELVRSRPARRPGRRTRLDNGGHPLHRLPGAPVGIHADARARRHRLVLGRVVKCIFASFRLTPESGIGIRHQPPAHFAAPASVGHWYGRVLHLALRFVQGYLLVAGCGGTVVALFVSHPMNASFRLSILLVSVAHGGVAFHFRRFIHKPFAPAKAGIHRDDGSMGAVSYAGAFAAASAAPRQARRRTRLLP